MIQGSRTSHCRLAGVDEGIWERGRKEDDTVEEEREVLSTDLVGRCEEGALENAGKVKRGRTNLHHRG